MAAHVGEALHERRVLAEATKKGGGAEGCDIYGSRGGYAKALGSKMKNCVLCGTAIQKKSFLDGATYFCPRCQR